MLNLALNCLHLINRTRWTTTVGSAAAREIVMIIDARQSWGAVTHVPAGHRVVRCHAPDSRTVTKASAYAPQFRARSNRNRFTFRLGDVNKIMS